MTARYIVGDVFDVLVGLDAASIDLVLTSPPFLALRSYLPAGHPDKGKEIGSEATPADFIDRLLDVVEACDRVLAPHGSICFELGDTYAAEPNQRKADEDGALDKSRWLRNERENGVARFPSGGGKGWLLGKSLAGIPQLFMLSLAYGRNMLRPDRQTPPWRVRNVVAWCRPNPPVGALADKYRPATSYLTVACKQRDRYFDLDAVRQPSASDHKDGEGIGNTKGGENGYSGFGRDVKTRVLHPAGAPPLDWWQIPTQPYPGAHYATWPEQLCVVPIKSMCPTRVCRVCGQPSRRIVEAETINGAGRPDPHLSLRLAAGGHMGDRSAITVGWSDCGHNNWRTGCVLDPFAGSGTTLAVATGHGRDAIGIDLDQRNAQLAVDRVGPLLLEVVDRVA